MFENFSILTSYQKTNERFYGSKNSCTEQQNCLYLCQISASSDFVRNIL